MRLSRLALCCLLLLLGVASFWRLPSQPEANGDLGQQPPSGSKRDAPASKAQSVPAAAPAVEGHGRHRQPTLQAASLDPKDAAECLDRFTQWTRDYLANPSPESISKGLRLAEARRPAFKQLIIEQPRAAIEQAVPMVVRQQLPAEIVARLEKRINDVGALRVFQGVPLDPNDPPVPTLREVELRSGGTYRAHLYGNRAQKVTWTAGAFVNGVAIDSDFAISEDPTRRLEVGEFMPKGKPVLSDCPVSGKNVLAKEDIPQVVPESLPAVETPIEIITFCDGSHIATQNQTILYGEGVTGGSMAFSGILPGSPTPALGQIKVIVIPATYADQNAVPATESDLYATLRDVADHYAKASYGRLSLSGVVTPPVKLPHNEAWYINRDSANGGDIGGTGISMADARAEAQKLGFDWNDYDCTVMRHNGGPGSYGGLGGGNTVWVRGNDVALWAHEIGHAFGLMHSNFWDTAGSSSIGNGANQEYGDSYDIMGGGPVPAGHYNAQGKNQIRWLPNNFISNVTQSGVYRIHAFDQAVLELGRRYALTLQKDAQRVYWGMLRSLYDSNPFAKNGLLLGWRFPNGGASNFQLIDTTNGSPFGKTDAPIALGSTFSDAEAGIHITTVNFNDNPRYIDVQINLGQFPENRPPQLSLAASATSVPLNATVTLTATASDPDGDPLAFQWQHFGDGNQLVSPNAAVISRKFSTAGTYVVSCTASDMRGASITRNQLITVGTPTTYTIEGRITLDGLGLQDVVVNANNSNAVITDADGNFTIPNLSANTYTLTALRYGYSFSELFNNSISVGPSFSGALFEATAQSVVSISAVQPNANEAAPVTPALFRLTRSGDDSQDLSVSVNSALGSATKGTDYTLSPDYGTGSQGYNSFIIPAGSSNLEVTVTPTVDSITEGPETVSLQLAAGNGYLVAAQSSATVVINDDDTSLPKVSIVASLTDTTEGAAPATFLFSRSGPTDQALGIEYSVVSTATAGTDFTSPSGTLNFGPGISQVSLNLAALDDNLSENLETVQLNLTSKPQYLIDPLASNAKISIFDDDLQTVEVSVGDSSASEVDLSAPGAVADTGTFIISRRGDLSQPLTVYYAFSGTNGTGVMALHGTDFEWLPGLAVIPAAESSISLTITPRFDALGEGTEQCVLNLGANATNYRVGTQSSATVNLNDHPNDKPYVDVIQTASGAEPATNANFRFTVRRPDNSTPLPISYTLSGSAENGSDYEALGWWLPLTSGSTEHLRAVWAADASKVWAVGDNGTILSSSDGATWSAQTSGSTQHLRGIWGSSASSLWAVGDNGTILRSTDGTNWSAQNSGSIQPLRAIWGSSAGSVWAVGDNGTILRSTNGSTWSTVASGSTKSLRAIHGSDANNIYCVGADGVILKYNGTSWSAQASGVSTQLNSVFAVNSTNIWAAGLGGVIRKGTGSAWSGQTSGTTSDLTGLWAGSTTSLLACGSASAQLLSSNGSSWTRAILSQTIEANALCAVGSSPAWSVGELGSIFKRDASNPTPLPGSLVIPRLLSSYDLNLRTRDDALTEDLETIRLDLNPGGFYQTFAPTAGAAANLRDNDFTNTIIIDTQVGTTGSITTTEAATGVVKFYLSRLGSTTGALQVNLNWGGTATLGSDYTAPSSVTIPTGALGADVTVGIIDDALFEGTENIVLSLAAGSYGRGPEAIMHVNDNDTPTATLGFESPSSAGAESRTTVSIPVTLSAAQAQDVSVDYRIGTGNSASNLTNTTPIPYWVRLVKAGNTISFYQSNDGLTWSQRGSSVTLSNLGSSLYLAGLAFAPGSSSGFTATLDQFSVTGLSVGGSLGTETSAPIGAITGLHYKASTVYTITTTGNGLSNSNNDQFFFVYLPVSNSADCTVSARVTAVGNGSQVLSRAGVMIRASTATGAVHASSLATGTSNGSFYTLHRSTSGTTATLSSAYTTAILPMWLRLARTANDFTQQVSRDNLTWVGFSPTTPLAWGPASLAGLAVSAGSDGQLASATYDNVTLNGVAVASLGGRSIGFVNEQGTESLSSGQWTVTGSGSGFGGSDEGHFPSLSVEGDFTLLARLSSLTGGASGAQAGLMARDGRDGYSRSAYVGMVKSGSLERRQRLQAVTNAQGAGVDFLMPAGKLLIPAGQTRGNITLNITDDSTDEANELITVLLLNPNGAALGSNTLHGYSIVDDDNPPAATYVGFASATTTTAESAGNSLITVSLSSPAKGPGSVAYTTVAGSASAALDYTPVSGRLSFEAGQSVKVISLAVIDDSEVETTESLTVALSDPIGLSLGNLNQASLNILDDDFPTLSISASDAEASEDGDPGQFTVTRSGSTASALNFTLTPSGTATSGSDYTALALSPSFAANQSSLTIDLSPLQDSSNEGSETVTLTLAANAAYNIGTPNSASVSLKDDDRSRVTLTASDRDASENNGNPGQFTVTRSPPHSSTLSVILTLSGTASNGSDYSSVASPLIFAIGEASKTISINPTDDGTIEGTEDVTLSLNTGSYDIGAEYFGTVRISDNDIPPTVFINQPAAQGPLLAQANGIIVGAQISDDGGPSPLTQTWSCIGGPGTANIESPQASSTGVTFSAPGTYVMQISATDGQFTVSDQVTVIVGSQAAPSEWISLDLGPIAARRGQSLSYGGLYSVSGTGAGYAATNNDQAHVMLRSVSGDGSIVARLTTATTSATALAGITLRDSPSRGSTRAVLGYVPGSGLQWRTRGTVSTNDTLVSVPNPISLPLWLKIERTAATNEVRASYAADNNGQPTAWTAVGTPVTLPLLNADTHLGLTTTSNSTSSLANARFDQVSVSGAAAAALINEDAGNAPNLPGSGSESGGVYTVAGSPTGYYHGWQYFGDLEISARLLTYSSGAGSSSAGLRIAESVETGGASLHLGRMPTSSYSGYYWTSIAGGSGGGVPSGIAAGNWIRIVRRGNAITGYRATHNSSTQKPNAWIQIGQPQTVIMPAAVWVGFFVNNSSGVGLNTCTFEGLNIRPLHQAPILSASVNQSGDQRFDLSATLADDNQPAAASLLWTQKSGPQGLLLASPTSLSTSANPTRFGSYGLRLNADDGIARSYTDVGFTVLAGGFSQWMMDQGISDLLDWQQQANLDFDSDGSVNLLEYAVGTNGTIANAAPHTVSIAPESGEQYLRMSIPRDPTRQNLRWVAEVSSDGVVWSQQETVIEIDTPSLLVVRDRQPASAQVRRLMRLRVELLP